MSIENNGFCHDFLIMEDMDGRIERTHMRHSLGYGRVEKEDFYHYLNYDFNFQKLTNLQIIILFQFFGNLSKKYHLNTVNS